MGEAKTLLNHHSDLADPQSPVEKRYNETDTATLETGLSLAAGVDVFQTLRSQVDMGLTPYLELRYSGQRWKHWSVYLGTTLNGKTHQGSHFQARMGAELYETWFRDRLITGLGVVIARPDQIVGTSMRYQIRFGWRLTPGWSLELVHESNCRAVCDNSLMRWAIPSRAEDGHNRGYNFLVLRRQL
jgi:hypothetical protein